MKVVFSERVDAELERHLSYGVDRFGPLVAQRTFQRVRRFLLQTLADYPRLGRRRAKYDVFEVVIPRTPFVAFYRIDDRRDVLTVVALFHHAQNRESEWGGR